MNAFLKNYGKRIGMVALAMTLLCSTVFSVQATNVKDAEKETSKIESDLKTLEKELDATLSQIQKKSKELKKIREELAIAKGKEEAQYESMMLRIKYMYENGSSNLLDVLLASNGLVEFISNAEYISQISKSDRKMLSDYTALCDEIAAKEKKLQKDQEYLQDLQDDLKEKEKSLTKDLASCKAKLEKAREEAKKAQEQAQKPVKPIKPSSGGSSSSSGSSSSGNTNINYEASDVELLAALLECEAGTTNYEGLLAVGSVVVNRMKHYKYPNTLRGVIYQTGQFPPATNGKVDRVLARGVKPLCVQAAQDALNGKNNVGDCLSFRAASSGRDGVIIGSNVFF